jgi:hypothetical protein
VEIVKGVNRLLRLLKLALNLRPLLPGFRDIIVVLTCLPLCQPLKLCVVIVDIQSVFPDPDHDGLEERLERLVSEEEDMATRLPDNRAGVELVRDSLPRENDMPCRSTSNAPWPVGLFHEVFPVRQTKTGSEGKPA